MKSYLLLLFVVLFPTPVFGQHLFMIITEEDQPQPVQLLSIQNGGIDVLDPDSGHQTHPTSTCLALTRPGPRSNNSEFSYIQLKDGQVFFGRPGDTSTPDNIVLNHQWFGEMHIPVDRVHTIMFNKSDVKPEPDVDGFDQVVLLNGDELSGFVSALSDPLLVEVDLGGETEMVRVPWSRIASIRLFGDLESPTFPMLWLEDGTIVTLRDVVVDDDWRLESNSHNFSVAEGHGFAGDSSGDNDEHPGGGKNVASPTISDIHAIVFSDRSIHALGAEDQPTIHKPDMRITDPGPFSLDTSAILGLSPLSVSGPTSMSWAIPEGVDTFRATARLTKSMMAWGNLDIEVSINGKSITRVHMDADSPEAFLFIPLEAGEMTITLHEALNGPVQDTVIFEYPMFFKRDYKAEEEA